MDRKLILAASESGWSPAAIGPLAWWYAGASYVSVNGASTVAEWRDRSGNGNTLSQATAGLQPTWDTSIWGGRPVLTTNSLESLSLTSGSALSSMGGADVPFSVFVTFRIASPGSNALVAWDNSSGNAASVCRCDNPLLNSLRYDREDDAAASAVAAPSAQFASAAHVRASYSFFGTAIKMYLDGAVISGAGTLPCDVGTLTLNRLRLFDGPGATDSLNGSIAEVVVLSRSHSATEASAYYSYSLAEWG